MFLYPFFLNLIKTKNIFHNFCGNFIMNTYEKIQDEGEPCEEIMNDNQLRNRKKKLKKFLEKGNLSNDPDPDLDLKVKKLKSLIWEYEHQHKREYENIPEEKKRADEMKQTKNNKNKRKRKKKKENEFLEREFEKNKEYWRKYEEKQKEKEHLKNEEENRRREEKEKRKEERKEKWKEWQRGDRRRYQDDVTEEHVSKEEFFKDFEIEEIPDDLSKFYDNYEKNKFKELSLKYHPDKTDYHVGYIKSVNNIKDIHNPRVFQSDETWTK